MNTKALAVTVGLVGILAVGFYFVQQTLKQTAKETATAAAPTAGYNAGKGAVDAVFQNVITLLNRTQQPNDTKTEV